MKVKYTDHLRLDELIKYCIDSDIFGEGFSSTCGNIEVVIYKDDVIVTDIYNKFNIPKTLFIVKEEVDVNEDNDNIFDRFYLY